MPVTDVQTLRALWDAIKLGNPATDGTRRLASVVKDGFVTMPALENVLDIIAPAPLGRVPVGWLLKAYEIEPKLRAFRPTKRSSEAMLFDTISAVELAYLLIELEALGIPIKAGAFIEAVNATSAGRAMLDQVELNVWWYRERGKSGAVIDNDEMPRSPDVEESFTTATGRKVTATIKEGQVIRIEASRAKKRPVKPT